MRITILELSPCADTLLEIRQHPEEGYLSASDGAITLGSGSRLRPRLMGTYAGGKATNVARVIDALLGTDDNVEVELIVFRPDSPEGCYIAELQSAELSRVRVRPVTVDSTARFCVNLSDPSREDTSVEFNISPRVVWQPSAYAAAIEVTGSISTDLLLLAGNPPARGSAVMADLPAALIAAATGRPSLTVDIGGAPLALILERTRQPDVIKINDAEFSAVPAPAWSGYTGTLVVTDSAGCTVWESGPAGHSSRVPRATGLKVYSTVGAGDAAHAAFTLARWVWGYDPVQAARFGMAAAAAAVSSPTGTRGITRQAVDSIFRQLQNLASG